MNSRKKVQQGRLAAAAGPADEEVFTRLQMQFIDGNGVGCMPRPPECHLIQLDDCVSHDCEAVLDRALKRRWTTTS